MRHSFLVSASCAEADGTFCWASNKQKNAQPMAAHLRVQHQIDHWNDDDHKAPSLDSMPQRNAELKPTRKFDYTYLADRRLGRWLECCPETKRSDCCAPAFLPTLLDEHQLAATIQSNRRHGWQIECQFCHCCCAQKGQELIVCGEHWRCHWLTTSAVGWRHWNWRLEDEDEPVEEWKT